MPASPALYVLGVRTAGQRQCSGELSPRRWPSGSLLGATTRLRGGGLAQPVSVLGHAHRAPRRQPDTHEWVAWGVAPSSACREARPAGPAPGPVLQEMRPRAPAPAVDRAMDTRTPLLPESAAECAAVSSALAGRKGGRSPVFCLLLLCTHVWGSPWSAPRSLSLDEGPGLHGGTWGQHLEASLRLAGTTMALPWLPRAGASRGQASVLTRDAVARPYWGQRAAWLILVQEGSRGSSRSSR